METFFALLAFCAGNSPAIGEIPAQRLATRRFDFFFDLRLNKQLSNTRDAGDLRRHGVHYDVIIMYFLFRKTRIRYDCSLRYRVTIVFLLIKDSVILINQRATRLPDEFITLLSLLLLLLLLLTNTGKQIPSINKEFLTNANQDKATESHCIVHIYCHIAWIFVLTCNGDWWMIWLDGRVWFLTSGLFSNGDRLN